MPTVALVQPRSFETTGRVLAVRPAGDGRYAITLGPPPDMVSWSAARPPRIGELVAVRGVVVDRLAVTAGAQSGTLVRLRDVRWRVVEGTELEPDVPEAWRRLVGRAVTRPLFRYQIAGAAWLASAIAAHRGALLCDEPGLGKTIQTVAAICAAEAFPALVVCPATLREQWRRELALAAERPEVALVEHGRGELPAAHVLVMSYGLLRARTAALESLRLRVVVFDEVHMLKEPRPGKQHRAALATRLAGRVGSIVGLSGTPVLNRPRELWRLLHLADGSAWPSFATFAARYCTRAEGVGDHKTLITRVGVLRDADDLQARMGPYVLRRLKRQVLADLPRKSRRSLVVRLGERELAQYRAVERDVVAWLRSVGATERARRAERARTIAKFSLLRRVCGLCKLRAAVPEYLLAWCERTEPEPLVVFGYHREVMQRLWWICQQLDVRAVGIGSADSPEARQRAVDAFQAGAADVFLAPVATAGVGLNLQRASEALFVERVLVPAVQEQAEDRIHRIGTTRPVTITYLDAAGTVDEHLRDIIAEKTRLVRATVGDADHDGQAIEVIEELADRLVSAA